MNGEKDFTPPSDAVETESGFVPPSDAVESKKKLLDESVQNGSPDLSVPVKQDTPPSPQNTEPIDLPASYQNDRSNYKDLVGGGKYKLLRGGKPVTGTWDAENQQFVKDPLLDYSVKPKEKGFIEQLAIPIPLPESEETTLGRVANDVDVIQQEAADKFVSAQYLSSFQPIQQLQTLEDAYKENPTEELKQSIDTLKSKKLSDTDFEGIRFDGDKNVYQGILPAPRAGEQLVENDTELPKLPKTDMTVGEAYNEMQDDKQYVEQAVNEVSGFNSFVNDALVKKLPEDKQQYLASLTGTPMYQEELIKSLEQSDESDNVAIAYLKGLEHSLKGIYEAGSTVGLDEKQLYAKMLTDYNKDKLFGFKPEGIGAEIANSLGGLTPDVAAGAVNPALFIASFGSRMPEEQLKNYYFDKIDKGEKPNFNEAWKYATTSTALQAGLLLGAGAVGGAAGKIAGNTLGKRAAEILTETAKRAGKDAVMFGAGGTYLQNKINKAYEVTESSDYLKSMVDMGVIGAALGLVHLSPQALKGRISAKTKNEVTDMASFMPPAYVDKLIKSGIETGKITDAEGNAIMARMNTVRRIVAELPKELSLEEIAELVPLYEAKDALLLKQENASPTIKDVLKGQIADLDQKILVKAAIPLSAEEKAERASLIKKEETSEGNIDKLRLNQLNARHEAVKNGKEQAKANEIAEELGFDHAKHLLNAVEKKGLGEFETVQEIPKEVLEEVKKENVEEVKPVLTKAQLRAEKIKLLKNEPQNLRQAIMQFFLSGGKVNTDDVKRYLGTRTKEDWQDLIGKHKNGGNKNSADLLANEVFGEWLNRGHDEQEIINEIFDVLPMRKSDMEADLRGAREQEDFYNEYGISKEKYERLSEQEQEREEDTSDLGVEEKSAEKVIDEIEAIELNEKDISTLNEFLSNFTDENGVVDWDAVKRSTDDVFDGLYTTLTEPAAKQINKIIENGNKGTNPKRETPAEDSGIVEVAKEEKPTGDTAKSTSDQVTPKQDLTGKEVSFSHAGSEKTGTVQSVDKDGNLKVRSKDGVNYTVKPTDAKVLLSSKSGTELISEGWNDIKEALTTPTGTLVLNPKLVTGFAKIGYGLIKEGQATAKNVIEKIKKYIKENGGWGDVKEKDFNESAKEIEEKIKELNQKSFLETMKDSPATSEEMKVAVAELDQFYEVLHNKEALAEADKKIAEDLGAAKEFVLSNSTPSAEKSAMAVRLIKHYEKAKDYDSAIELVNAYDNQLREAGRFVQAASLWNKLSPETVLRTANREAEKAGQKLSPEVQKEILRRMGEVDKMPEGAERDKATLEVLNYIAEQLPYSIGDWLDAYRYQNMLSNPRSHERNIYGNLFNVFLTEPASLAMKSGYDILANMNNPAARDAKIGQVPKYFQDALMNIPNAFMAAKETYSNGYAADKILDIGNTVSQIEALRRTKLPKYLTVATRFLEAQDRFFSVLIGQGEKMRLMRNGVSEADATAKATKLAEEYLYREKMDASDKSKPVFVRSLDALGKGINDMRRLPVIGKPFSWFVPFVTTPINVAKMGVKFSPLGFVGGKEMYSSPNARTHISNAALGTIATGVGATLAMQGLTSWSAPRDKKERELFYASGRKPYSVKVGDKWFPMAYFGPFALSLALPASVKHYQEDTKTALTDSDMEQVKDAILSTSGFVTSQTPLSSTDGFFKAIGGDEDYTVDKVLGYVSSQAIPLAGMIRYINTILDPVYRKSKGYIESVESGIPELSKELEPIKTPDGKEAEREPTNALVPYDLGFSDKDYEIMLKTRRELQQERELARKKNEEGGVKKLEKAPKMEKLPKMEKMK